MPSYSEVKRVYDVCQYIFSGEEEYALDMHYIFSQQYGGGWGGSGGRAGVGASGAQGSRPVPGGGDVGALCGGIRARVEGGYGGGARKYSSRCSRVIDLQRDQT